MVNGHGGSIRKGGVPEGEARGIAQKGGMAHCWGAKENVN